MPYQIVEPVIRDGIPRGGVRGYATARGRKIALRRLVKTGTYNHFVMFRDSGDHGHPYALMCGRADWLKPGQVYIDR